MCFEAYNQKCHGDKSVILVNFSSKAELLTFTSVLVAPVVVHLASRNLAFQPVNVHIPDLSKMGAVFLEGLYTVLRTPTDGPKLWLFSTAIFFYPNGMENMEFI